MLVTRVKSKVTCQHIQKLCCDWFLFVAFDLTVSQVMPLPSEEGLYMSKNNKNKSKRPQKLKLPVDVSDGLTFVAG